MILFEFNWQITKVFCIMISERLHVKCKNIYAFDKKALQY